MLTHYLPRNFLSPIFLKICTKIPQDVPINEHAFVFLNKSLLQIYKTFYSFGFFNSAVLSCKTSFEIFTAESLSLAEFVSVGIFEIQLHSCWSFYIETVSLHLQLGKLTIETYVPPLFVL